MSHKKTNTVLFLYQFLIAAHKSVRGKPEKEKKEALDRVVKRFALKIKKDILT